MKKTRILNTEGFGPFITKLVFSDFNGIIQTWESRLHRKGIHAHLLKDFKSVRKAFWKGLLQVSTLNWWISILFAIGASLFIVGSILSLWAPLATYLKLSTTEVNYVFFFGSIPFTSAASLQLLQAYLATKKRNKSIELPKERKGLTLFSLGFLSALFQFVGTVLFNINTFESTKSNMTNMQTDLWVWSPDFVGSILFLISGYLAFIEVGHRYWKWEFKNISWWVVFINLLGCIAFMISACFAFIPRDGASNFAMETTLIFTLIGGLCFFVGALSMLPEMGMDKNQAKE